jgi:hypothetical protein
MYCLEVPSLIVFEYINGFKRGEDIRPFILNDDLSEGKTRDGLFRNTKFCGTINDILFPELFVISDVCWIEERFSNVER